MNYAPVDDNRTIKLALWGSLLLHGLIFIFSGKSFIPRAQFSIQPSSVETVEISLQEMEPPQRLSQKIISTVADNKEDLLPTHALKPKDFSKTIRSTQREVRAGVLSQANPDYYQNPPPEYPQLAKEMHQEGLVLLLVDVNPQGTPANVQIKQSSGHHMLDEAALKAVWDWKFQPGHLGAVAIESSVVVPIRFELE